MADNSVACRLSALFAEVGLKPENEPLSDWRNGVGIFAVRELAPSRFEKARKAWNGADLT